MTRPFSDWCLQVESALHEPARPAASWRGFWRMASAASAGRNQRTRTCTSTFVVGTGSRSNGGLPMNVELCPEVPLGMPWTDRCGVEKVLEGVRLHRCKLKVGHSEKHACWCDRGYKQRGKSLDRRGH